MLFDLGDGSAAEPPDTGNKRPKPDNEGYNGDGSGRGSSGGGGSLVEAAAMPSSRVVVPVEGFVAEFMQSKDGNQR